MIPFPQLLATLGDLVESVFKRWAGSCLSTSASHAHAPVVPLAGYARLASVVPQGRRTVALCSQVTEVSLIVWIAACSCTQLCTSSSATCRRLQRCSAPPSSPPPGRCSLAAVRWALPCGRHIWRVDQQILQRSFCPRRAWIRLNRRLVTFGTVQHDPLLLGP